MKDRHRLEQLHALLARIERMPESPQRTWMLREVRSRAVDVESGVRPAALRPLEADVAFAEPAPVRPRRPAPRRRPDVGRATVTAAPRLPPPRAPTRAGDERVDLLAAGLRLSLEDLDLEPASQGTMSPWARGLRG